MNGKSVCGIHALPNGRKYRLLDHGEYVHGEYPSGGIHICCWEPRIHKGEGGWLFVSNSPDEECAKNFLAAAARLPSIDNVVLPAKSGRVEAARYSGKIVRL